MSFTKPNAAVVPKSIDRPKRVAKELSRLYPKEPLNRCQTVTAKLYGHSDWHHLDEAIKRGKPSAPFDEDCSDEEYVARWRSQSDLLCRELGGVDPHGNYPPPGNPGGGIPADQYLRIKMAFNRWHQLFSVMAIDEINPTAAHFKSYPSIQLAAVEPPSFVCELPRLIAGWWKKKIPHQKDVATAIGSIKIDTESSTSLMIFGAYWGELCMHYASSIPVNVAIAGCYYLAERFADIRLPRDAKFRELMGGFLSVAEEIKATRVKEVNRLRDSWILVFLNTLARDDYAYIYERQPGAVFKNAESGLKKLRNASMSGNKLQKRS